VRPSSKLGCLAAPVLALVTLASAAGVASEPSSDEGRNLVGTIDVRQGTATQLAGSPTGDGPQPVAYEWVILEGHGGSLLFADRRDAIFEAPKIETELERFIVEVTVQFEDQRTFRTQVEIHVHRDEIDDTQWLDDFYSDAKKSKQERQAQNPALDSELLLRAASGYYSRWPVGFGWGWGGGFVSYHATVPIFFPY